MSKPDSQLPVAKEDNLPQNPEEEEDDDNPLTSKFASFLSHFTPAPQGVVRRVNDKLVLAEDSVSADISIGGHTFLAAIFILATLAYTIFTLVTFFTRPEIETFLQLPARDFPSVPITIEANCLNKPYCGTITVQQNYSSSTAGCTSLQFDQQQFAPAVGQSGSQTVQLCFTEDQIFSSQTTTQLPLAGVQVDFSGINPGVNKSTTPHSDAPHMQASATVDVKSSIDPTFGRMVNMDSWQIKALVIGQNIKRTDGVIRSRQLFPQAIQYEGKRPNWRATLLVTLAPLVNVYDTSRPGTVLEVIASIGGAISMISGALLLISPVVGCISPGYLADAEKKEEVELSKSNKVSLRPSAVQTPAEDYEMAPNPPQ